MYSPHFGGTSQLAPYPCYPVALLSCSPTAAHMLNLPLYIPTAPLQPESFSLTFPPAIPLQLVALPYSCACLWFCRSQRACLGSGLPMDAMKPVGLPQTQAPHGLVKASGHVKSTQGMSLDYLALVMW